MFTKRNAYMHVRKWILNYAHMTLAYMDMPCFFLEALALFGN